MTGDPPMVYCDRGGGGGVRPLLAIELNKKNRPYAKYRTYVNLDQ